MPRLLAFSLLGWAIAFFGSFLAFYLTPATDFGLAAGWNKVTVFLKWQMVATVLAVICLVMRWTSQEKLIRRLAAIPAVALAFLLTGLACLMLWLHFQSRAPVPMPPPKPVTAPAADVTN